MNITIGETIKRLRNQKGVTQEKLADALGLTPQAVSKWESGAGLPAIDYLPDLSAYFGVSVDELLGVKLSKREARREQIYEEIRRFDDETGYDPSAIEPLREMSAEFPRDEKISFALAKALCSERWEEKPDMALLREAEHILRTLIRQTDDYDFKFECAKRLAVLYKEVWLDKQGYEEVVNMLPSLSSCRESFVTDFFIGSQQKKEETKDCIMTLALHTLNVLRDYVAYELPNDEETWDDKLSYFEIMIDFFKGLQKIIGGEKASKADPCIATLYRYMATYHVAADRYDETLDCLENSLVYTEKTCANPLFEHKPHNLAWYDADRLAQQDRYDPVREDPRFIAIMEKLNAIAK